MNAMASRFSLRRAPAPEPVPPPTSRAPRRRPPALEAAARRAAAEPKPKAPAESDNPLLSDKLLDAKVRLHRRLIEEINLSALEKLPRGRDAPRTSSSSSRNTSLVERLALNAQELDEFVAEILDEMTGLGPARAAAQGPDASPTS